MGDGNGSRVQANPGNIHQVVKLQGQLSRQDPARATGREAYTANDQTAFMQMAAQTIENLAKCGISVRQWQARDSETQLPTVMIAILGAALCPVCGNYYSSDSMCGICNG